MLTIEPVLLRSQMAEGAGPNALLLKLVPTATPDVAGMPINLAIVIDNSTSMHIWRQPIREAIDAACQAVDLLGPEDTVSVVAFQDEARVFQPQTPARDKEAVKRAITAIQDWDSGGTRIAAGIRAALGQLSAAASERRAARLLVLTDGQAEDAPDCLSLARAAANQGVVFTTLGLGDQWSQHLLAEMAAAARGRWQYVREASELAPLFRRELETVKDTYISDLSLRLMMKQGVIISKIRQVEPEVADLVTEAPTPQEMSVKLFTLQKGAPVCLLAHLELAPRVVGRYLLGEAEAGYRGGQTERVRVELQVAAGDSPPDAMVLRYIDLEQIDTDYRQAMVRLEQGAADEAGQLLMRAHAAAVRTGDGKRARLIHDAVAELQRTGQLSPGIRLAGLDEVRRTNLLI